MKFQTNNVADLIEWRVSFEHVGEISTHLSVYVLHDETVALPPSIIDENVACFMFQIVFYRSQCLRL